MIGRIIKGIGGKFEVLTDCGIFTCEARGIFKKDNIRLIPGDLVEIGEELRIDELYPRKNEIIRPPISNITQSVLVISVKNPEPNLKIIDTVILSGELENLKLLIVINKADLSHDRAREIANIYGAFDVIQASSVDGEGIFELKERIKGEISVFSGASGAGKSTLLNHIIGEDYFEVGDISEKLKRGKNTTRHVELYPLSGDTLIADSPGYTSLKIPDIDVSELQRGFREFQGRTCKFLNCTHREEPSCGVKEGVEAGEIPLSRYNSYISLYEELLINNKMRYR